jgi:hypothetical protein
MMLRGKVRFGGLVLLLAACKSSGEDTLSPSAFTDGLVAIVDNVSATGWPRDGLTITAVTVTGDTLRLQVSYGGGCARHRFAFLVGSAFMESHPVQVHARISHDAGGDTCRALISRALAFDLSRLKQRYREGYGPGAATIVINLAGHSQSVRYHFE